MKRKKRLVLTALITCLGVFLSVGIYLVVPKFLAGDTQVTDLTLKSQVNNQDQTIQLTITDQNQADTKVVVPLTDKLSYTPTTQPHAGVTYDQVNHQIVIDWLAKHPKTVNLTVKATQAGTYVFKAQTTRNDTPVNTAPASVTVPPKESTPTSSIQSNNQATLSEKVAVPGLQEPNTTSSQSLDTKQATQQQKNSTKDLPEHADTDIVTPADFDNQKWLFNVLKKQGLDIEGGNVTFGDLKKVKSIISRNDTTTKGGHIPTNIKYFQSVTEIDLYGGGLVGNIPAELIELPSLEDLNLAFNPLTGKNPIFENNKKLKLINVENTMLSGIITASDSITVRASGTFTSVLDATYAPSNIESGFRADSNFNMAYFINYTPGGYFSGNTTFDLRYINNMKKLRFFSSNNEFSYTERPSWALCFGNYGTIQNRDITYQIYEGTSGKLIYDGPFEKNLEIEPKDDFYIMRMDHTKETLGSNYLNTSNFVNTLIIKIDKTPLQYVERYGAGDKSSAVINQVKNTPIEIQHWVSNTEHAGPWGSAPSFKVMKMTEKVNPDVKDKLEIDSSSFEVQKPNTKTWETISKDKISPINDGYQISFDNIELSNKKENATFKIRYDVMAKESFSESSALMGTATLESGAETKTNKIAMNIKNGQLLFNSVPGTMSFADSKIANMKTEIKRKLPDWKMQIEDTRLNKTDWHITANLISELKNSNGDSLGDSVIFKQAGQPNQVINTTNAVDVYDGKATADDYQDVQWSADTGPALSVAPGLAKLGSYTGTMQWTLVDAPA